MVARGEVPPSHAASRTAVSPAEDRAAADPGRTPWVGERELVRHIHDDRTGNEWRIFERDARQVPGSRGPRCLYFDAEGIVRRVWAYPPDWHRLSPGALLALMERPPERPPER